MKKRLDYTPKIVYDYIKQNERGLKKLKVWIMKIYLMKTNAGNEVVFYQDGMAKITDCAPTGMLAGTVDIVSDNAAEELKKYFSDISGDLNGFWEMPGDEIEFNPDKIDADLTEVFSSL